MFKIKELIIHGRISLAQAGSKNSFRKVVIDSRQVAAGDIFVAIKGKRLDGHDFIKQAVKNGAGCIIAQKDLSAQVPKSVTFLVGKDTLKVLGYLASYVRNKFNPVVIAVTGSNGKTTTKDMLSWVLSGAFKVLKTKGTKNNHIGLPMTLLELSGKHQVVVLELGTNHFGEIEYLAQIASPDIGVITNIGCSHLEYLKDLQGVFSEKYSLIRNLRPKGIAVFNYDDPFLYRKASGVKSPISIGFGINKKSDFQASSVRLFKEKAMFVVNNRQRVALSTCGQYNVYNALSSVATARILGVSYKQIASRLRNFKFPQGRLSIIKKGSLKFIDDTYNCNPLSLKMALQALKDYPVKKRRILVMADMLELGENSKNFHKESGEFAAGVCDVIICVGKLAKYAAKQAVKNGAQSVFTCESAQEAKNILLDKVNPDKHDLILVKGSRSMKMEGVIT
ncbi:MAG: UDP-N-acetylmuramoyl-tripeptide--D-alanyl-D-alanine ligase [Candidatus Omnitrophica bacterium]|jgi:UDP-N-acetylmuramoyl-tripeptide--D-alanyl-D-alanine ligase|nr:UDP-N-acetylmuramoyl-tripeptide--D-alanyl-D-alanine ligase [Candidatus Omnitrophota bacterium]